MTHRNHVRRVALLGFVALLAAACTGGGTAPLPTIPSLAPATPTPAPTHPGPTYPPACPTSQPPALTAADTRTVKITTDKGAIEITIKGALSPIATGNFVALASCGYFDGVVFHRLVPGFVIQGGDGQFGRVPNVYPDLVGSGGPPYTIKDEPVTTKYVRGTVAMARTSQPNSVNSQFFIVLSDAAQPALAQANTYQIIGSVSAGMDVVDAIAAMPNSGGQNNSAINPVAMTKVTVSNP